MKGIVGTVMGRGSHAIMCGWGFWEMELSCMQMVRGHAIGYVLQEVSIRPIPAQQAFTFIHCFHSLTCIYGLSLDSPAIGYEVG
jgi:hypothetical protein